MPAPVPVLRVALLTRGDPGQRTGGHLYNRRMAEAAAGHGARIEILAAPQRAFPLASVEIRRLLRRLQGADVLVLDSIAAAECSLSLVRPSVPLVALLHQVPGGVDHGPFRTAIQARLDLGAYRRAARLIVVSEYLSDWLQRAGFDGARIAVVPPGRNPAPEAEVKPTGNLRQGRAIALLCVSNWLRNKGIDFILEALAQLPAETATLHLVGDDRRDHRYARELRRHLGRDDLRNRVVVHGSLAQSALAGLYRGADVFVLPSLHEAYGAVCAEAMTVGLPVIASRTDNLPYLLRDGVDGLLVKAGDANGLASAVRTLAEDPELRRRLGNSAQRRALELPTWEEAADRFFDEVSRAAGGRGQGAGARSV